MDGRGGQRVEHHLIRHPPGKLVVVVAQFPDATLSVADVGADEIDGFFHLGEALLAVIHRVPQALGER